MPIEARAYAKINLGLEVLGKRADGLHEVATVLQTIDLADRLRFAPAAEISLRCRGMAAASNNLVLQAAHLLREKASVREGASMLCEKRIPVAGGLGGGSADAAATLRCLASLWGVRVDEGSLLELGAALGADVPFSLWSGTAFATGTGRTLERLPRAPAHWIVLVPMGAREAHKTADMYACLSAEDFSEGALVERQVRALQEGRLDYGAISSPFSGPAAKRWPAVARALARLRETGALAVSIAGSGPSSFGLYGSRARAREALHFLRGEGVPARLSRFV